MEFLAKTSSGKKRLKHIPCDISLKLCNVSFKVNLHCFKIHQQLVAPPSV